MSPSPKAKLWRSLRPAGRDRAAARSALTRLEPAVGLVDHIDPALAPHDAVVAVTAAQGFQRITDFHDEFCLCLAGFYGPDPPLSTKLGAAPIKRPAERRCATF